MAGKRLVKDITPEVYAGTGRRKEIILLSPFRLPPGRANAAAVSVVRIVQQIVHPKVRQQPDACRGQMLADMTLTRSGARFGDGYAIAPCGQLRGCSQTRGPSTNHKCAHRHQVSSSKFRSVS